MDLEKVFQNQNKKKQVKILTCGSVDDGKSTLLGRLLYDSQNVFVDQMDQVKIESEKYGTQGKDIDLASLSEFLLSNNSIIICSTDVAVDSMAPVNG